MIEDTLTWAVIIIIMIAGVWLTILTYIVLAAKRRSHAELVAEIKKSLEAEQEKARIVPLLNEMLETESTREARVKIRDIKRKAKKIDVSDIADLMEELDAIVEDSMHDLEEIENMGKDLDERMENIDEKAAVVLAGKEAVEEDKAEEPVETARVEAPAVESPDEQPPVITAPAEETPAVEESKEEIDCIVCGSPIPNGDKKCPGCGTLIPQ